MSGAWLINSFPCPYPFVFGLRSGFRSNLPTRTPPACCGRLDYAATLPSGKYYKRTAIVFQTMEQYMNFFMISYMGGIVLSPVKIACAILTAPRGGSGSRVRLPQKKRLSLVQLNLFFSCGADGTEQQG